MSANYLVADIGGTKSELAVYSSKKDIRKYVLKERLNTREYESLPFLILSFLQKHKLNIDALVLALAGPVINKRVTKFSSNLPWEVDAASLRESLTVSDIRLVNDLKALAGAIPHLRGEDLHTINRGVATKHETLAVIAPGTGLGEAFIIWDGSNYRPCISEGAHVNFGPRSEQEIGLLRYLKRKKDHVSYESVCSGLGIPAIYEYLTASSEEDRNTPLSKELDTAEDLTRSIIDLAGQKRGRGGIAEKVLQLFVSILGAETGNLVLKTMAAGGVFLAGGIPPRIIPYLDSRTFLDSFFDKGIMTEMMPDVPIHIITNPDAAIMGAADFLFNKHAQ
jgi:glucokinase